MSFLSLAFLAALPLAAAPILLHFFDRRRNVVIEWGAMQFLLEAATRRTSARRLKQWLLLLLRVLAVIALVLALARPMVPGSWFGGAARAETIFVVDNSMSMSRVVDKLTLFAKALEHIGDSLEDLEHGDFVRVLLAAPYPTWATSGNVRVDSAARANLGEELEQLHVTGGSADLLSSLFTAVQAKVEPTVERRRIVVLTDGQENDWKVGDEDGWRRFHEALQSSPVPTELETVELVDKAVPFRNVAINGVASSRTVVGVGQACVLTASVQNYSRRPSGECSAVWRVAGLEQHTSDVPLLEPGASRDVVWKHSFSETGVYAVSCALDADDDLAADDSATAVIEVVDEIPVLLVESRSSLAEMQRDTFFVQAALGWINGESLSEQAVHLPTVVDGTELERVDLSEFHAIVISSLTDLSEEMAQQLRDFVSDGGGLWIAVGPRTEIDAFNRLLFADGNGLSPLAIDRIIDEEPAEQGDTQLTRVDPYAKPHPATEQLLDSEQLDLADVTISRRFRFVPPPESEPVSTLLSLTNGEPLVVEKYTGRGRVIVQAVPLCLQWTGLARANSFVVMVQAWLDYLTEPSATRYNLQPGEPIAWESRDSETREVTLRLPPGDEIELSGDVEGQVSVFRSSRTILPGDYYLEVGLSGDRIPFYVRRHPEESDLSLRTVEREDLPSGVGASQVGRNNVLANAARSEPLWPALLLGLISLIAGELLLAGAIARERFGADPIAETAEHLAAAPTRLHGVSPSVSVQSPSSARRSESVGADRIGVATRDQEQYSGGVPPRD